MVERRGLLPRRGEKEKPGQLTLRRAFLIRLKIRLTVAMSVTTPPMQYYGNLRVNED